MSYISYAWDSFLILISGCITYFITQRQWNRENTRRIKEKILPKLKESLKSPMDELNRNHIIGFSKTHTLFCYFKERWFLDWFSNFPPFRIENDELIFSYNYDKNMNKYIENILTSLKGYKYSVLQLKEHLDILNLSDMPETFGNDVRQLLIETSEARWFDEDENYLLFRLYVALLADSLDDLSTVNKEPYKGRNYNLREWEQLHFQELKNIIQKYPAAVERRDQLRRDIADIKFYLLAAQTEVNAFDHEW